MKYLGIVLSLFLIASCERTLQTGDTDPPAMTVFLRQQGLPVIYTSDATADLQPAPQSCPAGTQFRGGTEGPVANRDYILPAGASRVRLAIGFADPSGIRSAEVITGYDPSLNPDPMLDIVDLPRHGGRGTARFYRWQFAGTSPLRSPQIMSLDLTPSRFNLTGTILTLTAMDGAGNRQSRLFFIYPQASACQ